MKIFQTITKGEDTLKLAFEAGEAFASECHCGECDYCIEKTEKTPNFQQWKEKVFGAEIVEEKPQPKGYNEFILCAAIHYKNNVIYDAQPTNIESGMIICGRRHHNCIIQASNIFGNQYDKTLIGPKGQGFLTSWDRYVDRKEGYKIAKAAGQIWHNLIENKPDTILTSEDLYMKPKEYH